MTSGRREESSSKRERIREHLRDLVESLEVGSAIPSERQLCEELGVSRPTVRSAVDDLVRDGLLVRQHGRGMFVAAPKIAQELTPSASAGFAPKRVGGRWNSRTVDFTRISAGARVGRRLRLSPADPVLRITRLRIVDDVPIAIDTVFVPESLVPGLRAQDLQGSSFYQLLSTRYTIEVDEAVQSIEPTVTDEDESALLGVPVHFPALLFERTTADSTGRIVEFTHSVYRGDRYRILTRLKLSGHQAPGTSLTVSGAWDDSAHVPGADTITTDPYFLQD
ncbi:GntR family transcriptional regulator [Wenjunlia tyrosinilytica]|uniref:Transcriptional regulator n=1 Tax=Wenjunlia tyrosinilytica TaxID=1544741 RepID=A0A918DYD6_9ACTN|nr:GntR family transcriptional regulator [Wenjunlia tyrosinilytica]GGO91705.1 transcriptional regulator [Wenjunlia tyrosinilytica]